MTNTTPTPGALDLPQHRIDYIARQYFADEQYQAYVKHAIHDAFQEARRAAQPSEPTRQQISAAIAAADKLDVFVDAEAMRAMWRAMGAQPSEPDECAANMNGHRFGPHGRKGEIQCEWCGAAQPSAEKAAHALDALDGMGFTYDEQIGWLPPKAAEGKLPPLPSTVMIGQNNLGMIFGYNDRQMSQYARDAIAASRRTAGKPVGRIEAVPDHLPRAMLNATGLSLPADTLLYAATAAPESAAQAGGGSEAQRAPNSAPACRGCDPAEGFCRQCREAEQRGKAGAANAEGLDAGRECLQDVVSHHGDFHMACTVARDLHLRNGDRDSADYWDKQLHVLARMKVQAETTLADKAPATSAVEFIKTIAKIDVRSITVESVKAVAQRWLRENDDTEQQGKAPATSAAGVGSGCPCAPKPMDGHVCPCPTTGQPLCSNSPAAADAEARTRDQIKADAHCILRLLGTVDKLVGSVSGATESIQEHAQHIIQTVEKLPRAPATSAQGRSDGDKVQGFANWGGLE